MTDSDLTGTVAKHYNELQEAGIQERTKSRIFYQRNFHNWIKSVIIGDALDKIRQENKGSERPIRVLDLCSGKGGDLLKWKKGGIDSLVCADIAGTSVEQCEARYKDMLARASNERHSEKNFTAEFITADCTKQRLRDLYKKKNTERQTDRETDRETDSDSLFDLVSCQFSFHYSFESESQAEMMLRNACECLRPGGYFIGTTPNAYELVKRLRASDGMSFGNEVYKITFEDSMDKSNIPLFGGKYDFDLDESVHCPEFVVYFPLLEKLAEKYDMKLVYRTPFADIFAKHIETQEGRSLAGRMQAFEPFPSDDNVELVCKELDAYARAAEFVKSKTEEQEQESDQADKYRHRRGPVKVGTLSKPEWEASTLYLAFAFQRQVPINSSSVPAGIASESTSKESSDGAPKQSATTSQKRKQQEDEAS